MNPRFRADAPTRSDISWDEAHDKADADIRRLDDLTELYDEGWEPEYLGKKGPFDRYTLGFGPEFLACPECGAIAIEIDFGCHNCGFGDPDDE